MELPDLLEAIYSFASPFIYVESFSQSPPFLSSVTTGYRSNKALCMKL